VCSGQKRMSGQVPAGYGQTCGQSLRWEGLGVHVLSSEKAQSHFRQEAPGAIMKKPPACPLLGNLIGVQIDTGWPWRVFGADGAAALF